MKIHKEGFTTLIGWTIFSLLLIFTVRYYWPHLMTWVIIVCTIILFLLLQFFRSPMFTIPVNVNHILAPADGKIVAIEEVDEPEYLKKKMRKISVFMSPFNVHVNRNPTSGMITYFKYHPGKYLVAWHPKSSELNERTTVAVKTNKGDEILYRQIAGVLARRIRWYIEKGDSVKQGDEFGFIKFGSRVDVFIPLEAEMKVKINDITKGGRTVLATWE